MNTAAVKTKRKNIEIREDVYRFLSIKAADCFAKGKDSKFQVNP